MHALPVFLVGHAAPFVMAWQDLDGCFACMDQSVDDRREEILALHRIARDLLACLPAKEVRVTAEKDGKTVFSATYPRQLLLHRNFAFIDPVRFAEECGAEFK